MDWNNYLYNENEKPLDRLVDGYSRTSVFRSIAFIGDSLSSGEFEELCADGKKHFYDYYDYSWGQYIARKNGLLAYNFSMGGMTAKKYIESFAEEKGFWDKDKATQAYVIALGVNDLGRQEVGTLDGVDVNDWRNNAPTFIGYYAAIISRYKEISPNAKFFLVGFPRTDRTSEKDAKMLDAIEKFYGLTELFDNCYMIDLYKYGPVYDERFREKFYLHGHLNASGYIFTAQLVDSYIDYIVRKNPSDFKNVGFIASDKEKYMIL